MLNELTEIEKKNLNLPLTDKGIDGILYDKEKIKIMMFDKEGTPKNTFKKLINYYYI